MKPWYEIWVDEGLVPPYVLVVMSGTGPREIAVHDPQESARAVYRAARYDEIKLWLLEDEYTQVGGRQEIEE